MLLVDYTYLIMKIPQFSLIMIITRKDKHFKLVIRAPYDLDICVVGLLVVNNVVGLGNIYAIIINRMLSETHN